MIVVHRQQRDAEEGMDRHREGDEQQAGGMGEPHGLGVEADDGPGEQRADHHEVDVDAGVHPLVASATGS